MRQWLKKHAWLSLAGVIPLLLILAVANPSTLRNVMALPLVLFLPGFALTLILFKRVELGTPERLLLSVGLSVALTALIGLLLNWTRWGLTTTSLWITFLAVLATEVVVILLIYRKQWIDLIHLPAKMNFSLRQWILMSLAALVTLTALYIARTPVPQQGFEGYTTLWLQPSDQADMIRLGVNSEEFETTEYQIRFELAGAVYSGPTLELQPGERWEGVLRLPTEQSTDKQLKVLLYRLDHPNEIYRHAVWWLE